MVINGLNISEEFIETEAKKWHIAELSLFGSVVAGNFTDESDIDLLVTFEDGAKVGLFDLVSMRDEFANYFHRKVDLVEKSAIKNPFRRESILSNSKVIYAA